MEATEKYKNRLINEKSPYLLQHAHNPVDWYAWDNEAFNKARTEDKPIFLSIGYSTCHWCHVMEKETFENEEIASLMNRVFVSIKVDREERPEIDNIYMIVCQMLNGSGGWPLSIVMTPDKKPFFAGTYFPPEARYGRIGMKELIVNIESAWKHKRDEINDSVNQIFDYLKSYRQAVTYTEVNNSTIHHSYEMFESIYDTTYGGFGNAPKFPSPHNFLFLLRYWNQTGKEKALEMVTKTLTSMRNGGIYDHIGFGFHRYSTDKEWLVPHFEKMLYDQALHIISYSEAFLSTGNEEFKNTAEEVIQYILRDMTPPLGGFYSAEDADSEGEEGKFYLWSKDELYNCLGRDDGELAANYFNITSSSIPNTNMNISGFANYFNNNPEQLLVRINAIRLKMHEYRKKRTPPYKDDKILCDWNGLMITALAIAGRSINNSEYIEAAENAAGFIKDYLTTHEGKLLHRYRDGSSELTANLDDYAFIIWSQLELYRSTFKKYYIDNAIRLTNIALKHFWDDKDSGFYLSPDYSETILIRNKEFFDGAIPCGNSVMLYNLLRLFRLTANPIYEDYFQKQIKALSGILGKSPFSAGFSLISLDYSLSNSNELIICYNKYDTVTEKIISKINSMYLPYTTIIFLNKEDDSYNPAFEYLDNYYLIENQPTFYFCKDFACELPTTDFEQILSKLGS